VRRKHKICCTGGQQQKKKKQHKQPKRCDALLFWLAAWRSKQHVAAAPTLHGFRNTAHRLKAVCSLPALQAACCCHRLNL
jgi:hypothetical protein